MIIGGGGGDARGRAGRPFEGDLGGIRLWLLPHFRPWHHFQMVFMKVQICRGLSKTLRDENKCLSRHDSCTEPDVNKRKQN